jgi:hypothetical protein
LNKRSVYLSSLGVSGNILNAFGEGPNLGGWLRV